jgi:hypothetical protein
LSIAFDRLNQFFRMIACFKGHGIFVNPALLKIKEFTLLKILHCRNLFKFQCEISHELPGGYP